MCQIDDPLGSCVSRTGWRDDGEIKYTLLCEWAETLDDEISRGTRDPIIWLE